MSSLARLPPRSAVTPSRLDVFSKVELAAALSRGINSDWAQEIYFSYLQATKPDGNFNEDEIKHNLGDYFEAFQKLVRSLREQGFDESISNIPMTKKGIENGSHRLAACLVLGQEISVCHKTADDQIYDWRFLNKIGLADVYKDRILSNYVDYMHQVRALVVTGRDPDLRISASKYLANLGYLVGEKSVNLTPVGVRRLMSTAYFRNDWWDDKFLETMVAERYSGQDKNYPATVLFFQPNHGENPREIKEHLRKSLSKNSFERQLHGTDEHVDTVDVAQFFLNKNALQFHNNAPIGAEDRILKMASTAGVTNNPDLAVDGGSVLEIFGIRKAADLDYVSLFNEPIPGSKYADLHNSEYVHFPINPTEVILDPRKHFILRGTKFASLGTVLYSKSSKLDEKNTSDFSLILGHIAGSRPIYLKKSGALNRRIYSLQSQLGRFLEPQIQSLPRPIRKAVRSILRGARILFERVFRL